VTEIYQDESRLVFLDIRGANADATPVAKLQRAGSADVTLTVTEELTGIPTGVQQRWSAYVTLEEVAETGPFKIYWTGTAGGEAFDFVQYYEVVVPYVHPREAAARLGWQFDNPTLPGYQDYDRVVAAELIARTIIGLYCQQKFGAVTKTVPAQGTGRDTITLTDRILKIKKIYDSGTLVYDTTVDPVFNWTGLEFLIGDSGYSVRIGDVIYAIEESEELTLLAQTGRFVEGRRYEVTGDFGFEYVPVVVKEAAILLINDLICQDSTYRNRYVNHVAVKDWKFSYDTRTWAGTGNALVDDLLSEYKVQQLWVI
jgi:hypothetical protein